MQILQDTQFSLGLFSKRSNFYRRNFQKIISSVVNSPIATADFNNATFGKTTDFRDAYFEGFTNFSNANFEGEVNFASATFKVSDGFADFTDVTFDKSANFLSTTFIGPLGFYGAKFVKKNHVLHSRNHCPWRHAFLAVLHLSVIYSTYHLIVLTKLDSGSLS